MSKAEPTLTPEAVFEVANGLREQLNGIVEAAGSGKMPASHIWRALVRFEEGLHPPRKGGRPRKADANIKTRLMATRRAQLDKSRDGKNKKKTVGEVGDRFGLKSSAVCARIGAASVDEEDDTDQLAGDISGKPVASRR